MQKLFKAGAALSVGSFGLIGAAQAAVPTEVTSALDTLKTDGVAMATTVLVAIIAVFAIKFLRRGV